MDDGALVRAMIRTILHYSDNNYGWTFGADYVMPKIWFNKFVKDWGVARTIKGQSDESRSHLLRFLNTYYGRSLYAHRTPHLLVDRFSETVWEQGWSYGKPRSLISKVGYFYRPDAIIPMDNLARKGLVGLAKEQGVRITNLSFKTYSMYYDVFHEFFEQCSQQLVREAGSKWVARFVDRLGHSHRFLNSRAFFLKLFDCFLMEEGLRREPT